MVVWPYMDIPTVSKSDFKNHVLEYLRQVEKTQQPLIIRHFDTPVLQVLPYRKKKKNALEKLRGSVLKYEDPFDPVDAAWEALK